MKKILSLLCAAVCIFALAACGQSEVYISCEGVNVGAAPEDVSVEVRLNDEAVEPRLQWSMMGEKNAEPLTEGEFFEPGEYYELYIYYPMAEDTDGEKLNVIFEGGGEHMYTRPAGDGELVSLVAFDFTDATEININCEGIAVGAAVGDVTVQMQIGIDQPLPRIEWSVMEENGVRHLEADETFRAGSFYEMYLYYPIPPGDEAPYYRVNYSGSGEHLYTQVVDDQVDSVEMMTLVGIDFTAVPMLDISCSGSAVDSYVENVEVTLTLNGESLDYSRLYWSVYEETASRPVEPGETFKAGMFYQLCIYYSLPDGAVADEIGVTVSGEGEHLYTQPNETDNGSAEMISLVGFDFTDCTDIFIDLDGARPDTTPADAVITMQIGIDEPRPQIEWYERGPVAYYPMESGKSFVPGGLYDLILIYPVPPGNEAEHYNVIYTGPGEHMYTQVIENDVDQVVLKTCITIDYTGMFTVTVSCPEVQPGMLPPQVQTLMANGIELENRIQWNVWGDTSIHVMEEGEVFKVGRCYSLHVYIKGLENWNLDQLHLRSEGGGELMYWQPEDNGTVFCQIEFDLTDTVCPGHQWDTDKPLESRAPTCDSDGYMLCACRVCGETSRLTLEGGHIWGEPEYWNSNVHGYTCGRCGDSYTESHKTDSSGKCHGCGGYIVN